MKIKLFTKHDYFKRLLQGHDLVSDADQSDLLISYDWPKKIPMAGKKGINLHVSYLPFNRGTNPNLWSWIDDTPKGVTIHWMDEGIDTGDIIVQEKLDSNFLRKLDLRSSYEYLHYRIEELFKLHFPKMLEYPKQPQDTTLATRHFSREMEPLKQWLEERGYRVHPDAMVRHWNSIKPVGQSA